MKRRSQRFLLAACTALAVVATLSTALRAYGQSAIGARDVEQLHGDTLDLAQPGDGAGDLCCFVAGRGRPEAAAVSEAPGADPRRAVVSDSPRLPCRPR